MADLILDQEVLPDPNEVLEYTELIKQSSLSLIDLSKDILSKDFDGESHRIRDLKEGETNLIKLRETILHLLAPQLKVKNINFSIVLDQENQFESFSKLYVLQILGNLLSNSIKFTKAGGDIAVLMNLKRNELDLYLELSVEDNGMGMSSAKVDEILDDGTSTDEGTRGEKGFGLGLKLVKQLVNQQNGIMEIDSKLGEGTKFFIKMKVN
mgnify:CR=1 FL=1